MFDIKTFAPQQDTSGHQRKSTEEEGTSTRLPSDSLPISQSAHLRSQASDSPPALSKGAVSRSPMGLTRMSGGYTMPGTSVPKSPFVQVSKIHSVRELNGAKDTATHRGCSQRWYIGTAHILSTSMWAQEHVAVMLVLCRRSCRLNTLSCCA